jgi:hypothetical protein
MLGRFYTGNYCLGVVVALLNSECSQQDRANEHKHGAYCQYFKPQGKGHGSASLVDEKQD